jgi:hypothetical protein
MNGVLKSILADVFQVWSMGNRAGVVFLAFKNAFFNYTPALHHSTTPFLHLSITPSLPGTDMVIEDWV